MFVPVVSLKSSPSSCCSEAVDAKVSTPGRWAASCASSCIVFAGTDGCTTSTDAVSIPRDTAAKSRSAS